MTIDDALDPLRNALRADGADLIVESYRPTLTLRLAIGDQACAECILPRAALERTALAALRRFDPSLADVAIVDPRE